jgi:rifampin ADP-ribosylating transferase
MIHMTDQAWSAVTHENCSNVQGPFYHGTKTRFQPGDLLIPGCASNFEAGRVSHNVYFAAALEPAIWGAELATALAGTDGRGHVYIVEPTGTFEDDPNLTNKRFPGNPTTSYRTRAPLRIVGEVKDWQGHPPEVLQQMLDHLDALRRAGRAVIED